MAKKSHLETTLKKATIELLLLKLLDEGDMYGYQLSGELKRRSNGQYTILEGSMYPILYRLTEGGYISFYETKVGVRQTRVYYISKTPADSTLKLCAPPTMATCRSLIFYFIHGRETVMNQRSR